MTRSRSQLQTPVADCPYRLSTDCSHDNQESRQTKPVRHKQIGRVALQITEQEANAYVTAHGGSKEADREQCQIGGGHAAIT